MKHALIGYTGFVGGYLDSQRTFTHRFNRANLDAIGQDHFNRVICAGMPAAKWIANREPDEDDANTDRLISGLGKTRCDEFVLISTIDIYQNDEVCNETTTPRPMHTYGKNRHRVELFVQERFPNAYIIRLPALFGPGLKKNALFDLMHDNQVDRIHPGSEFQWYDLRWLPDDIDRCRRLGIHVANLFTEPVSMARVQSTFFPEVTLTPQSSPAPRYMHTTSNALLSGVIRGGHAFYADDLTVMQAMGDYLSMTREIV